MKRKISHAPHPCLLCREITTNKTYCHTHSELISRPQFVFPLARTSISADTDFGKGRRRESVNVSRG